ncbi:AAA domain protein, partial [Escherichia coli 6-175-07_S3_C2]
MTLAAITMTAPEAASPVQMYRATYSPDDNKLRLYAASRLDPETYKKVHDAGFRWAPKQALFVAPAWTPGREDMLLSLAGEIEDEDSTLAERQEARAERFTPLMERVPGELMEKLTSGQRAATRMILETSDRFTVVQGYAGVGKTTQFRAVMSAVNMLPESERPRVVGLGPTHRAVGEMRSAGVDAQTLASFLHDTQLQQRSGETPDFSNTLFLLDESSMVGNTDMARAYALIAAGGGRAVASGDTDQLQAIAPGQPFRLQQTRSAADVAIMKEIVRQTPELRE